MERIFIDFELETGRIKRMHAVNNVQSLPYIRNDRLKDAKIPYARLHDTGGPFGGARYVDVANVFPNFDADENDPGSYDFAFTDVLLLGMVEKGIKPFYRLGATIENNHTIKAYNIYPPKDFAKWARICEHIIMHYNEGWANGFNMDIEYWEIWNEPDNAPDIALNPCWKGTKEEFFELYRTASVYLKGTFPNLKIGGYASCGFYALNDVFIGGANSSSRTQYFVDFFEDFLHFIKENSCPLDFFSWHSYTGAENNVLYAKYARERLDAFGYKDAEIFLNEWNPEGNENIGTARDAADILSMMIAMQGTPTDMCMYYDAAERSTYCGIFNRITHGVHKAYYSFLIFGKMYEMGTECYTEVIGERLYALGARGNGKRAFAIVNDSESERTVELKLNGANAKSGKTMAIDDEYTYEEVAPLTETVTLPPYAIRYVEFD